MSTAGWIRASYHLFGVFDGDVDVETGDRGIENGLVQVTAPGCCLIHTGIYSGQVHVTVDALAEAPDTVVLTDESGPWDEIIEVSVSAPSGELRVGDLEYLGSEEFPVLSPSGPGSYRVRVHARGRDDRPDESVYQSEERYLILIWPAPAAGEWIIRATDQTGADMRGYAAKFRDPAPEYAVRESASRPPIPASGREAVEYLRRRGSQATGEPVAAPDPARPTTDCNEWTSK